MSGELTQTRFLEDPFYEHQQLYAELEALKQERNRLALFCGRDALVMAILLSISLYIFKTELPKFEGFDQELTYLTLVGPEIVIAILITLFGKEASTFYLKANADQIKINETLQSLKKVSD